MSDENIEKPENEVEAPTGQPEKKVEKTVPIEELVEERRKRQDLEKRLGAMEKAHNEAETKRLQEQQDYKALYERTAAELADAKPKAEQLTVYETTLKETLAAQIEEIPQDRRGLIPEELSVEAQLRWISKNRALLSKAQPFDIGAGKTGGGKTKSVDLTPEELQVAKDYGMTPDEYAKYKDQ